MKYLIVAALAIATMLCAPSAARAAAPCSASAYHQFDFFLGRWNVKDATGKTIGTDTVTKRMNGCVIFEQWQDASGPGRGFGLSGYRSGRHGWYQAFMDDTGFVLTLEGGVTDGMMRLRGQDYPPKGTRLHDVTWTHHAGVVEEVWKMSADGGKHWKVVFDGIFHRVQ